MRGGWKSGWNLPAASLGNTEANSPTLASCGWVSLDGGPQELSAGNKALGTAQACIEAKAAFHRIGGPGARDPAKDPQMTGFPKSTPTLGTSELPTFIQKTGSTLAVYSVDGVQVRFQAGACTSAADSGPDPGRGLCGRQPITASLSH